MDHEEIFLDIYEFIPFFINMSFEFTFTHSCRITLLVGPGLQLDCYLYMIGMKELNAWGISLNDNMSHIL